MRTRSQANAEKRTAGDTNQVAYLAFEDGIRDKRCRPGLHCEAADKEHDRRGSLGRTTSECFPSPTTRKSVSRKRKEDAPESAQNDGTFPKKRRVHTLESGCEETSFLSSAKRNKSEGSLFADVACRVDGSEIQVGCLDEGAVLRTGDRGESPSQGHIFGPPVAKSSEKLKKDSWAIAVENAVAPIQEVPLLESNPNTQYNTQDNRVESHQQHIHESNVLDVENYHQIMDEALEQLQMTETLCEVDECEQKEEISFITKEQSNKHLQGPQCNLNNPLPGSDIFSDLEPCTNAIKQIQADQQCNKFRKSPHNSMQKKSKRANQKASNSVTLQTKLKKSNIKGITAAKLRWKQLIQKILDFRSGSNIDRCDDTVRMFESGIEDRQDTLSGKSLTVYTENKSANNSMQKSKRALQKGNNSATLQTKLSKSNMKRITAAKLRWKQLIQRILDFRSGSNIDCCDGTVRMFESGIEDRQDTNSGKSPTVYTENKSANNSMQKKSKRANQNGSNSVTLQTKLKKSNMKGITAAKLRWKQLIRRILDLRSSSNMDRCDGTIQMFESGIEDRQDMSSGKSLTEYVDNCQSHNTEPFHSKRKRSSGCGRSKVHLQRQACRRRPKISKELRSFLRWMRTSLIQANFSQVDLSANGQSNIFMEEAFIMTDDERNSFAETMVKACRQDQNLRKCFIESVRTLTLNGFMHAAASTLLQEENYEQAQIVVDAWTELKECDISSGPLPVALLKAVNQLHECRGDLSIKLNQLDGAFSLKQLDLKAWKLILPILVDRKTTVTKSKENKATS